MKLTLAFFFLALASSFVAAADTPSPASRLECKLSGFAGLSEIQILEIPSSPALLEVLISTTDGSRYSLSMSAADFGQGRLDLSAFNIFNDTNAPRLVRNELNQWGFVSDTDGAKLCETP